MFWLVPCPVSTIVLFALVGFVLGTNFPGVVVVATQMLLKHLYAAAIRFVAASSVGGGAILSSITDAYAQAKGVSVLQLAILTLVLIIWRTVLLAPLQLPQNLYQSGNA